MLELQYLAYLDLSTVFVYGGQIPGFVGNLSKLRYLNLSSTFMGGEIPPQFANLSNLEYLDLGFNNFSVERLDWLSHLSSLRQLVLSGTNLSKVHDWLQIINQLPHLTRLQLRSCNLPDINIPSLTLVNFSRSLLMLDLSYNNLSASSIYRWLFNVSRSMLVLDLSINHFKGPIPEAFWKFDNLAYLDLSYNQFEGSIPEDFGNISSLDYLDLRDNKLENEIPKSIWTIPALRTLYVDSNNLSGQLPIRLGQLSQLENLGVSSNSLGGVISDAHLSKLFNLRHLDLSANSFVLSLSPQWVPPFYLDGLLLGSCYIGPHFPKWLQTQKNYSQLDLSGAGIHDSIPHWFWDNLSTELFYLNLSNNNISGMIPNNSLKESTMYPEIDLSSNNFEGPIPLFLFKSAALHLSRNKFSMLNFLCDVAEDMYLSLLDISYNELFGKLPDCWSHFPDLSVLNLENNKLSGQIPASICSSDELQSLNLGSNRFTGNLPSSLKNCKQLMLIDVGENELFGPMPTWIGESLENLVILSLRSNKFNGNMLQSLCHLNSLQLLDLSSNNIWGTIPKCFKNFTAMTKAGSIETTISHLYLSHGDPTLGTASGGYYEDELVLIWKGSIARYKNTLKLVKSIDLSNNMLKGEVPEEITQLVGVVSLNLSRNNLSGEIPIEIGQLKSLDSLDLSNNRFSGGIPSSLTQVDRLSLLDLSNNNLSGKIPTGTQLQSFNATAYVGNPELCGAPLPRKCPGDEPTSDSTSTKVSGGQDDKDRFITPGLYISMGLGFLSGVWGLFGVLLFKKSWRRSYVNFLNEVRDWILVTAAVHKAKILRMIRS